MTKDRTPFAQRSQEKLYSDHKDMDYYLSWLWDGRSTMVVTRPSALTSRCGSKTATHRAGRENRASWLGALRSERAWRSQAGILPGRMGLRISLDLRDIARRVAKAYDYLVHGRADPHKILCPTLCLAGEGEAPITLRIAGECLEQLPDPMKRLRIFKKKEGGEAHCQVNNLALPNRVMFDWLNEVFS